MANRAMLFAAAAVPEADTPNPANLGLAEFAYDVPLVFKALASACPRACRSLLFEGEGPLAIAVDAAAALNGLRRLRGALSSDDGAAEGLDTTIAFLSKSHLAGYPIIVLEPYEILELKHDPPELGLQILLVELEALDQAALFAQAQRRADLGQWGEDCWTHVLYWEPEGRVDPPLDPNESLWFTDPSQLLAHAAVLPSATRLEKVTVTFTQADAELDRSIAALAALPGPFDLKLAGPADTLPPSLATLPGLRGFVADGLGLTALPKTLACAKRLEGLYLQRNRLADVPPVVRSLAGLNYLSLWGNPLSSLPPWIGELGSLETLLLNDCHLHGPLDSLTALTTLKELRLGGNRNVGALPNDVGRWTKMETLDLSDCGLTSLPEALGRLSSLRWLSLAGNKLTSLPRSVRALHLDALVLTGNPMRRPMFGGGFRAKRVIS